MYNIYVEPFHDSQSVLFRLSFVSFFMIVRNLVYYTYSRTQLYLPLLLKGGYYNNDMFRPYMWAIFRLFISLYKFIILETSKL